MPTSELARRLGVERLEDRRVLAAYSVDTHLDVVNASDGLMSLREAINAANATATEADTIDFEPTLFGATIQLQSGSPLVITSDLMISGLGAEELTVRGAGSSVFVIGDSDFVGAPKNVTISHLKITNGSSTFGAGIRSTENLTLEDSIVTANVLTSTTTLGVGSYGGAGIWASSSFGGGATPITTRIIRCEISNNQINLIPDGGEANPSLPGYNGGGVFARDTLVIVDSVITNNRAGQGSAGLNASPAGAGGDGGGVYTTGPTTITGSTITGNFAGKGSDAPTTAFARNGGAGGDGGGIAALGSLSIATSVINGNFAGAAGVSASGASGKGGSGGGVYFSGGAGASLSIDRTTIDGNAATSGATSSGLGAPSSDGGDGGGVWASGAVTIQSSTISNNSSGGGGAARFNSAANAAGDGGDGGGVWLAGAGAKTLINATISGNTAGRGGSDVAGAPAGDGGDGGGVWIGGAGAVTVRLSTITNNTAGEAGATVGGGLGGGVRGAGGGAVHSGAAPNVLLNSSIVAGNRRGTNSPEASDLAGPGTFTASYSLIGVNTSATIASEMGNFIGTVSTMMDPLLGPLADNGGPTLTHALVADSVAVNAGDPSLAAGEAGTPTHDQRGDPYGRVVGARIDMGSFELLDDLEPEGEADFDNDADVDGNDFLLWQRGSGDADADGDSDGDDLTVWREAYGSVTAAPAAGVHVAAAMSAELAAAVSGVNKSLMKLAGTALPDALASERRPSAVEQAGASFDSGRLAFAVAEPAHRPSAAMANTVSLDGQGTRPSFEKSLDAAFEAWNFDERSSLVESLGSLAEKL
jgi:hypothetical protein